MSLLDNPEDLDRLVRKNLVLGRTRCCTEPYGLTGGVKLPLLTAVVVPALLVSVPGRQGLLCYPPDGYSIDGYSITVPLFGCNYLTLPVSAFLPSEPMALCILSDFYSLATSSGMSPQRWKKRRFFSKVPRMSTPSQIRVNTGQLWQCTRMTLLICVPAESLTNHSIRNQVVLFRTESHRARGVFQQLRLVFLSGLAYRLYGISAQIEETRLRIEVRQVNLLPII